MSVAVGIGWRPAHAAAEEPDRMDALLARTAAAAGCDIRAVAATWHLEKHAWFAAHGALERVLAGDGIPALDGAWVRDGAEGWVEEITLPDRPGSAGGAFELAEALAVHLSPVVAALAHYRGRRALWRSIGDRVGQAALWLAEAHGPSALALGAAVLGAQTPLAGPGFDDGARRRSGCCLSHRCPGGAVCEDCVLA